VKTEKETIKGEIRIMRIFMMELKRMSKTRATWISVAAAVALSIVLAFSTFAGEEYETVDQDGNIERITGISAIAVNKEQKAPYEGEVTVSKLQSDLEVFHNLFDQYGGNIPFDLYNKEISPRFQRLNLIASVYSNNQDIFTALEKIEPNDVQNFYAQRNQKLEETVEAKYPHNSDVKNQVMLLNSQVKTPLTYFYGLPNNSFFILDFLTFILLLICVMINAPVFSAEYQTGSDDILRSTRNGRAKLAVSKLLAALLIDLILFTVSITIFILIVDKTFGWERLVSSAQIHNPFLFLPITVGEEQALLVGAGFLTLFATACFSMFLSTQCHSSTTTLVIAIAFCLLPDILYQVIQGAGNFAGFISCILPSGGLGINNNLSYQLGNMLFIQVGPFSVWSPYLIMGAAAIEIPLFFILAIRAYCKHQVS
jgi:ABC-type transport system involved in multi-copper enzyme maturation permease subunit